MKIALWAIAIVLGALAVEWGVQLSRPKKHADPETIARIQALYERRIAVAPRLFVGGEKDAAVAHAIWERDTFTAACSDGSLEDASIASAANDVLEQEKKASEKELRAVEAANEESLRKLKQQLELLKAK